VGIRRQPIQASVLVAAFLFAGLLRDSGATHAITLARAIICEPGQYSVTVTKTGGDPSWAEGTTGHSAQFTVQNGPCTDTYDFTFTATGPISGVTLNQTSMGLPANGITTVTATYNVDNPGTGQLTVYATGRVGHAAGADYYFVTATIAAGAPVVTAALPFLSSSYGRCANACFAAMTSRATVPYVSLDAPRQAVLTYNGDRVNPKAFVLVNVRPDPSYGSSPIEYQLRVKVNGAEVRFLNGEDTLHFHPDTATVRLGGQFDVSSYATNAYRMEVLVTAIFNTGSVTNDYITRLLVVNQNSSPVARGWGFAVVQRLYPQSDGSALVVEGDGSATYFAKTGTSTFTSPTGDFSTLVPSTLSGSSGWARLFPDSTKVVFTSAGLMTRVLDRFGNRDSVIYDGSNRVSRMLDPLSFPFTMTYGANGLASMKDSMGRVTTVTVDASKRLTAITDPDGLGTRYGYDGSLRLDSIVDRRGGIGVYGYDANSGTVATTTAPAIPVYQVGTVSPVTNMTAWQKIGVPYSATSGNAFTPPRADTVRARVTEPGGAVTRFTVNSFGEPLSVVRPLGDTLAVTYTSAGQPTVVKKPGYGPTEADTTLYNGSGLATYIRPAGLTAINIRYAAYGMADSTWGTDRPGVRRFIGTKGRVDSTRIGGIVVERDFYNTRGQIDSVKDGKQVRVVWNTRAGVNSNLSSVQYPGVGFSTTYGYDSYGRQTSISQPGVATRTTYYDVLNRPDSVKDGVDPAPIRFIHGAVQDTAVTDPKGQTYRSAYNALSWVTSSVDPAGGTDSLFYSIDGDLMRVTNRRGQHIDFAYDSLHRVISKIGSLHAKWGYLNHGRIVADSSPVAIDTSYANPFGVADSTKTAMAGQLYWRRYLYTPAGRLDSVQASGGGITLVGRRYRYNVAAGVLDTIRLNGAVTTFGFDNNYQSTRTTLSGGDIISRAYTTWHNTMQIKSNGTYNSTTERDISFNPPGRISEQDYAGGQTGVQYTYDNLSRLTMSATGYWTDSTNQTCMVDSTGGMHHCSQISYWTQTSADTFAYDAAGNRTDRGGSYTTGNRITQFDGCSYGTDADGNVTSRSGGNCARGAATFTWNAEGSLATIVMGSTTIALNYDAAGRLVRKDTNSIAASYFIWDGGQLLAELDGSGTTKRAEYSYYPGMDRLHALIIGTTIYYAHSDATGSVIALTDVSQNIKRTYSYGDVWGTMTGGSDNLPFNGVDRARWKGALLLVPELNLYYMRARWYEGGTGRFLSEDPLGLGGGINPYIYAGDDPINGQDPSGLTRHCRDDCGSGVWTQPDYYEQAGGHADQMDGDWYQWLDEAQRSPVSSPSELSPSDLACIGNASCAALADADWPTWYGRVGHWDPNNPQPGLTLMGGGTHGKEGLWTLRHRGQTDKWPQDMMPNPTDWGPKLGRRVEFYRGFYQDPTFNIRMEAFGVVWSDGTGYFVAKPSTSCECHGLPPLPLWP
jgi:RHS repeat-associated protein